MSVRAGWLVAGVLVTVACGSKKPAARPDAAKPAAEERRYVEVSEILRMMEKSEVSYHVGGIDKIDGVDRDRLAEAQWPPMMEPLAFPAVDPAGGGRALTRYPMEKTCLDALGDLEPLYAQKKYAEARVHYAQILEAYPRCYMASVYLGDAQLFDGDAQSAATSYAKVIDANPADYRGYFFRATALKHLGRPDEAVDHYAWALAMRPRYENVLVAVNKNARHLHLQVHDAPFPIRGLARREEERIGVYFDGDRPYWLAFAAIKAAWLGEPEVRRRMTGSADATAWTSDEERHALLGVLAAYLDMRAKKETAADPELDRLHDIAKAGMLSQFIIYEIASRMNPHIVPTLPREHQEAVHAYVKRFVLGAQEDATGS